MQKSLTQDAAYYYGDGVMGWIIAFQTRPLQQGTERTGKKTFALQGDNYKLKKKTKRRRVLRTYRFL